jgi:excinuclease ABC subunit A
MGPVVKCEGFGNILGIDPDLVIPDPTLSVYEGASRSLAQRNDEKMVAPLTRRRQ